VKEPLLADRRVLAGVPDPVTVRVPAKVNLHLSVGPRRTDGYHDVTSIMQAVSLVDEITAVSAEGITVEVSGEGAGDVPTDIDNLAVAAATRLARQAGVAGGVLLRIEKTIPVSGGMAGGSADAAAALVACDALWRTGLERSELVEIAASLGSDVPFALAGGTALATGRGENVAPVLARGQFHWVFALADRGLSTPSVYAEYDRGDPVPEHAPDGVLAALRAGDPIALGRALHNDLQAPALRLRPALRRVLESGLELGALGAVVCGSGPTCAFLARSQADATALAASIAGTGTCRSVRRAHGPVAGARVVEARESQ
jgi:4-diphosphocytidyl-2-C-methyl-D-erythritol kinase